MDAQIYGFYIAVASGGSDNFSSDSEGFGFLYHRSTARENEDLQSFLELVRILEVFLSAPSASLRRIRCSETGPEPVFTVETPPALADGCVALQKGALAFIKDFIADDPGMKSTLTTTYLRARMERLVLCPTRSEALLLGNLPYDGSKLTREDGRTFLPMPDWGDVRRPREVLKAYYSSNWRAGFLASRKSGWVEKIVLGRSRRYWADLARERLHARVNGAVESVKKIIGDG
jgi:hypothetical protein